MAIWLPGAIIGVTLGVLIHPPLAADVAVYLALCVVFLAFIVGNIAGETVKLGKSRTGPDPRGPLLWDAAMLALAGIAFLAGWYVLLLFNDALFHDGTSLEEWEWVVVEVVFWVILGGVALMAALLILAWLTERVRVWVRRKDDPDYVPDRGAGRPEGDPGLYYGGGGGNGG